MLVGMQSANERAQALLTRVSVMEEERDAANLSRVAAEARISVVTTELAEMRMKQVRMCFTAGLFQSDLFFFCFFCFVSSLIPIIA